jgi:DNA-binding transcriptional ArsR family regulator
MRPDVAAAARIFRALGSESRLNAYRRLAACSTGLPLSELSVRCDLAPESLAAALDALEAVGLVEAAGEGDDAWYSALSEPLAEALEAAGA